MFSSPSTRGSVPVSYGILADRVAETYVEDREGIFRLPQRCLILGWNIRPMPPQPDRSPVADGEGESEGDELDD